MYFTRGWYNHDIMMSACCLRVLSLFLEAVAASLGVDNKQCEQLLKEHKEQEGRTFPCQIGNCQTFDLY